MSKELLEKMSSDLREELDAFGEDFLIEVYRPWDCDEQKWLDGETILLRFENDDILIWTSSEGMECRRGSVDVFENDFAFSEKGLKAISEGTCLCWIRDKAFDDHVGDSKSCMPLLEQL